MQLECLPWVDSTHLAEITATYPRNFLSKLARRTTRRDPVGESAPPQEAGDSLPQELFVLTRAQRSLPSAHGAYQHHYHVVWIPPYRRRILRGAIKIFVHEHLPQIQHDHLDVLVQPWSVQIDHIHVGLVISPKSAVWSI